MIKTKVNINRIPFNTICEVRATGVNVFRFRMWLSIKLLQLAGILIGTHMDIDLKRTERPPTVEYTKT